MVLQPLADRLNFDHVMRDLRNETLRVRRPLRYSRLVKVVEGRAIFETLDNHTYVVNGPQAVRNANNADPSMVEFEGIVIALVAVGLVVLTMVKRKRRQ